ATTTGGFVDLDTVYPEVSEGGYVVLTAVLRRRGGRFGRPARFITHVRLYKVDDVAETSRAEFALAGKVSRLRLVGPDYARFQHQVRATAAFVQSEPLQLAAYPVDEPVSGASVPVAASADGLLPGRRLIVRGAAGGAGAGRGAAVAPLPRSSPRSLPRIRPPRRAARGRSRRRFPPHSGAVAWSSMATSRPPPTAKRCRKFSAPATPAWRSSIS